MMETLTVPATIGKIADWLGPDGCDIDLTRKDWRQYLFIHSGTGSIALAGVPHEVRPGALITVPAGAACQLRLGPDARGVCISASEAFLRSRVLPALFVPAPNYWRTYGQPQAAHPWAGDQHAALRDRVQAELETAAGRLGKQCDAAVIAYAFVILGDTRPLQSAHYADQPKARAEEVEPAQLLLRFRELVEQNYRHHLSISDYCDILAVTPVRLSRACKGTANQTPLSLIHERIILEAKGELLYTSKSISEIAYGLGFEDAAYFSRFFKQHVGDSPLDFKRAAHAEAEGPARGAAAPPG